MKITKITIVLLLAITLIGCAKKPKGPYADFQGQTAKQIYQGGKQALAKKKYQKAIKSFEALDALYPYGDYSQRAQLDIIYAYYENGDYDTAVAAADYYIHLYPTSRHVDYAYYVKGLANIQRNLNWLQKIHPMKPAQRDLSGMKAAFTDFNELVSMYPDSKYAPDARNRMIYIRNLLAEHELDVAKFYMKRKAYVAAANRASYIVQHFEGTLQVKQALQIMVKAYQTLGATKQAAEAAEVLQRNYPKNK